LISLIQNLPSTMVPLQTQAYEELVGKSIAQELSLKTSG
jgi:hypothetical protein